MRSMGSILSLCECRPTLSRNMLDECGAAMVIGNPAMLYPKDGLHVLDLAQEWKRLTGLPAVFAVWAGKGITDELVELLHEAKHAGMANVHEIAREESEKLGLPFELCDDYLSRIMVYDLGEREELGLRLFREKALAHDLVARQHEEAAAG